MAIKRKNKTTQKKNRGYRSGRIRQGLSRLFE